MTKKKHKAVRKPDLIEATIVACHRVAEAYGVRIFSISVGDKSSYQQFRRKESWRKYCDRMRKKQ